MRLDTLGIGIIVVCAACGGGGTPAAHGPAGSEVQQLEKRVTLLEQQVADIADASGRLTQAIERLTEALQQIQTAGTPTPAPANPVPPPPHERNSPDPATVYAVPIAGSPAWGPGHAKVTIVLATEFACPYCERVRPTLRDLQKQYGSNLRIVYKSYVVHPQQATTAALGVCAAAQQGKFAGYYDAVFDLYAKEGAASLTEDRLLALAKKPGLKIKLKRFKKDLHGDACQKKTASDQEELHRFGVSGVPSFFINGRFLSGARPISDFTAVIDEELAKFAGAGIPVESYYEQQVIGSGRPSL